MNQTPNAILCPHCQQPNSMRHTHCWSCTKPLAGGALVYLSGPINPALGIMVNGQLWQTGGPPQPAQAPAPPIINNQRRRFPRIPTAWLVAGFVAMAFACGYGFPIAMSFRSEMEFRGRLAEAMNEEARKKEAETKEAEARRPRVVSRDDVARAAFTGRTQAEVISLIGHPASKIRIGGDWVDVWGYTTPRGEVYVFFNESGLVTGWSDDPMAYR
ncbi:hypothetical protein [Microcystis phage Mae-JY24]